MSMILVAQSNWDNIHRRFQCDCCGYRIDLREDTSRGIPVGWVRFGQYHFCSSNGCSIKKYPKKRSSTWQRNWRTFTLDGINHRFWLDHYGLELNKLYMVSHALGYGALVRTVYLSGVDRNSCRVRIVKSKDKALLGLEMDYICEWLNPVTDETSLKEFANPENDPRGARFVAQKFSKQE